MISSTFVSIYSSKPKVKSTRTGKFHHSKKHHGDKKKSFSSRPKYDLTQTRSFFYILKPIRVFGISSATSSTRDFQRKMSARSWMRTKSQGSRPLQQFFQCCNSSHRPMTGRIGRGQASQGTSTHACGQVIRSERGTALRWNQESRSQIQSSKCVSA